VNVEPLECPRGFARPIELAHAFDGARDIVDGAPDRIQATATVSLSPGLSWFTAVQRRSPRRDCVVDVVRDSTGHFAQRAQPFGLHHGLLAVAQVFVGALERAVQLRLVRREGHVPAQLLEELAVSARECFAPAAHRDQHPKTFRFDGQRRKHQRMETLPRQTSS
jgi:hypothetical protein